MSRSSRFASALAALLVAHSVGDHLAQTDHQADHKAEDWNAMAGHVGSYTAVSAAVLALVRAVTGEHFGLGSTLVGLAFSAGTHAFIDRRWPVRRFLELTGSPDFATKLTPVCGPYQADQSMHHAALLVAALIIAGGRS